MDAGKRDLNDFVNNLFNRTVLLDQSKITALLNAFDPEQKKTRDNLIKEIEKDAAYQLIVSAKAFINASVVARLKTLTADNTRLQQLYIQSTDGDAAGTPLLPRRQLHLARRLR